MRITEFQFNNILERYLARHKKNQEEREIESLKPVYSAALKAAIEFTEENINADLLNLAAIGSEVEKTFNEQKDKFDLYCKFLDEVLIPPKINGEALFNQEIASAAKAIILNPKLSVLNNVQIYDSPQNLSIREKYSRGILTAQHWLTDTDLQRMLEITGTQSSISIMPFNTQSLGTALHFARQAHVKSTEPYTIPYILSIGSEGTNQGTHWIAAKITVNPIANTISYEIDDSLNLSPEQKSQYLKQIKDAILFDDGFHKAYPTALIINTDPPSHIKGDASQKDGYSCGYRALHHLLQDPQICGDNQTAQDYAAVDASNSSDLVRSFYQYQLEEFAIPEDAFEVLTSTARNAFEKPNATKPTLVRVNSDVLGKFIKDLPTSPSVSTPDIVHPAVQECIGQYTPGKLIMRFPNGPKIKDLDAIQYSSLFEGLLADNIHIIDSPLSSFILSHCDPTALDGLNAFYSQQSPTLFKQLAINVDLDDPKDADSFVSKLKFLMSNLSRTNLNQLNLSDDKGVLSEKHIQDLVQFIEKKQISIGLTLPKEYQKSDYQRQIDTLTGINRRIKNAKSLTEKLSEEKTLEEQAKRKPVRTRAKVNLREAMKIDIELQEGVEETVSVDKTQKQRKAATPYDNLNIHTLEQLKNTASNKNFAVFADSSNGMTKTEFIQQWHRIFGNIVLPGTITLGESVKRGKVAGQTVFENKELSGVSEDALRRLIEFKEHFSDGINIKQLPQGFVLIIDPKNPESRILHYDKNLSPQETISPVLQESIPKQPLSIDLVDRLIASESSDKLYAKLWNTLKNSKVYSRFDSEIFRKNVPDLMSLTDEQLETVLDLCGGEQSFDYVTLNFIFKYLSKAQNSYTNPYDETQLISSEWLENSFPKAADREKYIQLAYQVQSNTPKTHPLLQILEADKQPKLLEQLKGYHLTNVQLNGLLRIYDKYGSPGIEKILGAWNSLSKVPALTGTATANVDGYEALLVKDDLVNAVNIIDGFSKEQRQWWDKLYEAHHPKDDNLPNLVNSFTAFSKAIADRGLSFYELDIEKRLFKGAGNLPTTLGRMVSILNLSKEEDRKAQWMVMSKINLSAQGALRAMTNGLQSQRSCGFVTPEMEVDGYYISEDGYDTWKDPKLIARQSDSTRAQAFYRYIAHQKFRMPLSFYQEAVQSLEAARADKSVPADTVDNLYSILAAATTGDNYRYFINDVATAKIQWIGLVDNIKAISLPVKTDEAKSTATDLLASLPISPSVSVLAKLVEVTTKPLQNVSVFGLVGLKNIIPKLEENNEKLVEFVTRYGSKIYLGMQFYKDADFAKTHPQGRDLFEEHLEISRILQEAKVANELLPLISTFKIDTENSATVCDAITRLNEENQVSAEDIALGVDLEKAQINKSFKAFLLNYALGMLGDIENNEGLSTNELNKFLEGLGAVLNESIKHFDLKYRDIKSQYDDLNARVSEIKDEESHEYKELIAKINELYKLYGPLNSVYSYLKNGVLFEPHIQTTALSLTKEGIHAYIEGQFQNNFPNNYFENLKAGKPNTQIQLQIDTLFKDEDLKKTVVAIRTHFSGASDKDQLTMIESLAALSVGLSSTAIKELFDKLKHAHLLSAPIEQYNQLLSSIDKAGTSSFVYFMYMANQFPKPITELALKADYFLSRALPLIRTNKNDLINEIEVVDLIADLVLAGNKDEISKEYNLNPDESEAYEQLITEIKGKDLDKINSALDKLAAKDPAIREMEAIKDLEEHLAWYKKEEVQQVEVIEKAIEVRPKTGILHTLNKWTLGWVTNVTETEEVEVEVKKTVEQRVVKKLDLDIFNKASNALQSHIDEFRTYNHAVGQTLSMIESMVEQYPAAKTMILSFSRNFLSFNESDGTQIEQAHANLRLVHDELVALKDQDVVLSLCDHFGKEAKDKEFSYKDFLAIIQGKKINEKINFENYPNLDQKAKITILKAISSLLNNDKPCSLEDVQTLINGCAHPQNGNTYVGVLDDLFQCAPFPTIDLIGRWFEEAGDAPAEAVKSFIDNKYTAWNKSPVAREPGVNGFDLAVAKKQAEKMTGVVYSEAELTAIKSEVDRVQTRSTKELLKEIKQIKPDDKDMPTKLVALMAELLYRTKGLPQKGVGYGREWGRSFEINTTQYLAIHSMLKSGGHVTSQIGTGEGKSRIMMIAIACQYALGNTVDFVTSDLSLATRDYLEYQSFFKALGAETNLIYAKTPANEYKLKGINFSDISNLSLFRNKARSEGNEKLIIDDNPKERSLMLDEADKTYFDASDTRFNYSAQADQAIRDMPWAYELMVEFFMNKVNVDLYHDDIDSCNKQFYKFARGRLSGEDDKIKMARLEFNPQMPMPVISRNQLEAWQSSALTALALELNKDFTIKPDVLIQTKTGPQLHSQAQLISSGRASGNAKFSFGVHQCLHARLNHLRKNGTDNEQLTIELQKATSSFNIDSENQIVYSSTSKALLDDYGRGRILGVTGSADRKKVQNEVAELLGGDITFIDMPRHRGLNRNDLPVALAKNAGQHNQKILESIREALGKNPPQPILLVCENDTESNVLLQFLQTNLTLKEQENLTRISAGTNLSEEAEHVNNKAGKPGAITVSTAMLGRGTDIKLYKEPKMVKGKPTGENATSGLHVIGTYLPRERDYIQIIGRAGRFGAPGDSRLILNEERIKEQAGVKVLPTEFYTATESYLSHLQQAMDRDKQKQRIVKNAVGDFRLALTHEFFNEFYLPLAKTNDKDKLLEGWQVFFDKTDKSWNEKWPSIAEQLSKSPCDVNEVNHLLSDYQDAVKEEWKAMKDLFSAQINEGQIKCEAGDAFVEQALSKFGTLGLSAPAQVILQAGGRELKSGMFRTIEADKYDTAFIGRAVIYTHFGDGIKAFFNNIKAAWNGDGPWFPNLQAAMNGNMSWSQLFLGTWGAPLSSSPSTAERPIALPEETVTSQDTLASSEIQNVEFSSYAQILKSSVGTSAVVNEGVIEALDAGVSEARDIEVTETLDIEVTEPQDEEVTILDKKKLAAVIGNLDQTEHLRETDNETNRLDI